MEALPWSASETDFTADFTIFGQELTESETTHPTWCPRGCLLIELAPVHSPSAAAFRAGLAICCNAKKQADHNSQPHKTFEFLPLVDWVLVAGAILHLLLTKIFPPMNFYSFDHPCLPCHPSHPCLRQSFFCPSLCCNALYCQHAQFCI